MKRYNKYLKKLGMNIVGTPRYIHPSVYFDGMDYSLITLGDRTVISLGVVFLCHDFSIACGFRALGDDLSREAYYLKPITIGSNVFIGANCTILPGTTIGDNCIIGSGTVVKGSIEDDSIVVGSAGKAIANTKEWAERKRTLNDYFIQDQG